MSNFKKNLPSHRNYTRKKSHLKAISLASLSTLVLTLTLNNINEVNAMIGPVKVPLPKGSSPKTPMFYGSNGSRPISGIHNGEYNRPNAPKATGNVGKPGISGNFTKPSISLGEFINNNRKTSSIISSTGSTTSKVSTSTSTGSTTSKVNVGTSTDLTTSKVNVGTSTGSTTSKVSTSTSDSAGSNTGLTPKTTSNKSTQTSEDGIYTNSSNSPINRYGQRLDDILDDGINPEDSVSQVSSGPKTNKPKLTKKQKIALGVGGAGLGALGLGLGLGLGLNNGDDGNTSDDDKVSPPTLVEVPSNPPVYSTGVSQSAAGNLFIDEKVD